MLGRGLNVVGNHLLAALQDCRTHPACGWCGCQPPGRDDPAMGIEGLGVHCPWSDLVLSQSSSYSLPTHSAPACLRASTTGHLSFLNHWNLLVSEHPALISRKRPSHDGSRSQLSGGTIETDPCALVNSFARSCPQHDSITKQGQTTQANRLGNCQPRLPVCLKRPAWLGKRPVCHRAR